MGLTRNRLLLAKIESTYGTSSTPAGTDALLVSDLEVEPLQLDMKDRELIRPYLGNTDTMVVARRLVAVKFDVEIAGSGTAGTAPKYGPVLRSCGFAEAISAGVSVTYTPVSSSFSSVTMDFRADGVKHLVTGVRGTMSLALTTDEIPRFSFEMLGIYNAPTDTAAPSITFSNQAAPVVVNSTNTATVSVHSYAPCMSAFSLSMGNEYPFRQLAGCTREVRITDRKPKGELTIEAPTIAQKDYFTTAAGATTGAISWTHGTTAGNIVAFSASTCQLDSPTYEDSDGVQMLKLPFYPIPSSAGNDELSLVFT